MFQQYSELTYSIERDTNKFICLQKLKGVDMVMNLKKIHKFLHFSSLPKCSIVLFIGTFFALISLLYYASGAIVDSDMSSELILARLLSEEGKFISENWYYSTELRVISAQLIYVPLAKLFNDWHIWRFVSCVISIVILLLSYYFLCVQLKIKKYFLLTATIMLIPFSHTYFMHIYLSLSYTPYIVIAFCCIGLMLAISNESRKVVALLLFILEEVLAILAGMSGFRMVVQLYIPLFLSTFILNMWQHDNFSKSSRLFKIALTNLLFSSLGLLINTVILPLKYHYASYGETLQWKHFDINSCILTINNILNVFGYTIGTINFNSIVKNSIVALLIIIVFISFYFILKKQSKYMYKEHLCFSLYVLCALAILLILFSISTLENVDRYNLPITLMFIPILGIGIDRIQLKWKKRIITLFLLSIFLSGSITFIQLKKTDTTSEFKNISNKLCQENYYYGISSFWTANILTEMSDGKIDMRCWGNYSGDMSSLKDVTTTFKWLSLVRHDNEIPDGKIFLLFSTDNYKTFYAKEPLDKIEPIYLSANYRIIGFNSYDDMIRTVSEYVFSFDGSNNWILNGEDEDGHRIILPKGISYGPYTTLYPGTYTIEITGDNLTFSDIDCTYNNGEDTLNLMLLENSNKRIVYDVTTKTVLYNAETRVINNSTYPIEINSIKISKK